MGAQQKRRKRTYDETKYEPVVVEDTIPSIESHTKIPEKKVHRDGLSAVQPWVKKMLLQRFAVEIILANNGVVTESLLSLLSGSGDCSFVDKAWGNAVRSVITANRNASTVQINSIDEVDSLKPADILVNEDGENQYVVRNEANELLLSDYTDLLLEAGLDPALVASTMQQYALECEKQGKQVDFSPYLLPLGITMETIISMSQRLAAINDDSIQRRKQEAETENEDIAGDVDDILDFPHNRDLVLMADDDMVQQSDCNLFPIDTSFLDGRRVNYKGVSREAFPEDIKKYHYMRYLLASRIDDMYIDHEGWFSITAEAIGAAAADRFGALLPNEMVDTAGIIVDGFSGLGGNTIQFALRGERHVVGIDWDGVRMACAKANAFVYGVPRGSIEWVLDDVISGVQRVKERYCQGKDALGVHLWHFSPPWGGPEYLATQEFDVSSLPVSMEAIICAVTSDGNNNASMVFFLPRTTRRSQLAALTPPGSRCEVMDVNINGRVRALLAIYGDAAAEVPPSPQHVEASVL